MFKVSVYKDYSIISKKSSTNILIRKADRNKKDSVFDTVDVIWSLCEEEFGALKGTARIKDFYPS
jgi:hypothetical protein